VQPITFTIFGEPASKANSRRLVVNNKTGRLMSIKSAKALGYVQAFKAQCPKLPVLMTGDLSATITIHYASRRPDLDESVILDAMQGCIYDNDRQVREKHIYWKLDPGNPRSEITIGPATG
jgi:Holliday junction resolvase RusA-like endonuclease